MSRVKSLAAASALSLFTFAGGGAALAQNNAADDTRQSVLVLERVELDKILIAPKDQSLRKALKMLPMRLFEIPSEVPDGGEVPVEAIELATRLGSAALKIGVTYDAQNQKGGFGGAGVVVSFAAKDEAEANSTTKMVRDLLAQSPDMPDFTASKQIPTMVGAVTPAGIVRFGPRNGKSGWAFEIHLGTVPDPDANFKELNGIDVAGVTPFIKGRFDPAPLAPLLGALQVAAGGQPQIAEVIQGLMERNYIGPDAAKWVISAGHIADQTVVSTIWNHTADGQPKDSVGLRPISEAEFNLIPADAYFGTISISKQSPMDQIKVALEGISQSAEVLTKIKEETGVDLINDVMAAFGDTMVTYVSDSTGGGSLASQIILVSLADSSKISGALAKLETKANGLLAQPEMARGYVSVRKWADESLPGAEYHSLRFPGVPVPLEPTIAIANKFLIIGLSPQAAVAAVRQANGKGGPSILSNRSIASALPKGKQINSFGFTDSSRTLRAGYPFVSALGSMVGNLVRSRDGAKAVREPGMIVPTYAELAAGAKPHVTYSYWDGKNLISEWRGDESLLVNMGVIVGQVSTYWPLIAAAGGAAAAAAEQGRMGNFGQPFMMEEGDDIDNMEMDADEMDEKDPA